MERVRESPIWQFFAVLPRADGRLAALWWALLLGRAVLPAGFAIAMGVVVGAVQRGEPLGGPLALAGGLFVLLQVLTPLHLAVSSNLGNAVSAWLYDRLTEACVDPPGMRHLEDPELAGDLTVAREFDAGMTGPPMFVNMDFIATGMVDMVAGLASALVLFAFAWWAPIVLIAGWLSTHWLLSDAAIWRDRQTDEVRDAQRHADYAYRLAVDPPSAKELRTFGLAPWTLERFTAHRRRLLELQHHATRLRERPMIWCLVIVTATNGLVLWSIAAQAIDRTLDLGQLVVFAQAAVGASTIAFGGFSWAIDGASAPVAAVLRLGPAMAPLGALRQGSGAGSAEGMPATAIEVRALRFSYDGGPAVLDGLDLSIPAGSSLAIVGQNGAGKTTLAKLLCRLYEPSAGAITVDGVDLADLDVASWRRRVTAVFQDFIRFEASLRDNVAPGGAADDDAVRAALADAGAAHLAALDQPLSKSYPGGTDLSGGQWQRVALARALYAVRQGAGLVLLDEPTAQLDVRGEAEIFERILAATRGSTTILVSHRFSTVRHADRICVLEGGRVVEIGTHDELHRLGGRYHHMFELQASRFQTEDEEGNTYDVLA